MLSHKSAVSVLSCIVAGLVAVSSTAADVHTGRPLWRSFDTRQTGAADVTHAAAMDSRGIVYAANDTGLLSFDGLNWRLTSTGPSPAQIHAILDLGDGRWLAGGPKTLGTFEPNRRGEHIWRAAETDMDDAVLGFAQHRQATYVITDRGILDYTTGSLTSLFNGSPTGFTFAIGERFFAATTNGLIELLPDGNTSVEVPPEWEALSPVAVLSGGQHGALIVTRRSGLFEVALDGNSLTLTPLWESLPAALDTVNLTSAVGPNDSSFVFGTEGGAILHVDRDGKALRYIDDRSGFYGGKISALASHSNGNLLAFFDGGAVWLDLSDTRRVWDSINGLPGSVTAVTQDTEIVYAGTNLGLFRTTSGHRMRQVPEVGVTPIETLNMFRRSNMPGHTSLLIGLQDGLFDFFNKQLLPVISKEPRVVFISRTQPARIAVGSDTSISLLEFELGLWVDLGPLGPEVTSPVSDITETPEGDLLIVLEDGTVLRFVADQWLSRDQLSDLTAADVQSFPRASRSDLRPFFASEKDAIHLFLDGSTLEWNSRTERFEADTAMAVKLSSLEPKEQPLWSAAARAGEMLWLQAHRNSFVLNYPEMRLTPLPAMANGTQRFKSILVDSRSQRTLLATPDHLLELPLNWPDIQATARPLPALNLRSVRVGKHIAYGGEGPTPNVSIGEHKQSLVLEFAVFNWSAKCDSGEYSVEILKEGSAVARKPITTGCSLTMSDADLKPIEGALEFRLTQDGSPATAAIALTVDIVEMWYTRSIVPVLLGLLLAALSIFGGRKDKRVWPDPMRRYLAVASGLSLCFAASLAISALQPVSGPLVLAAWLGGLLVVAFALHVFAEILMRFGDRHKSLER